MCIFLFADQISNNKYQLLITQENPYALFLAGKLRRDFTKHPMIAIFHIDSFTGREFDRVSLFKYCVLLESFFTSSLILIIIDVVRR